MIGPRSLPAWLDHIERVHPRSVAMGTERIESVRRALRLRALCPVITVGGTNGKGSVCALLEAILAAAGYKVGVYSSPPLLRANERIRIEGADVTDSEFCAALAEVEVGRGKVELTYFEYITLAAMIAFNQRCVDVAVLEVGMGGRTDAVNIFDPDVSIISSIDLDHMEFLGSTREQVAVEKSGIFRAGRPAICGDPSPPDTLQQRAADIGANLQLLHRDFDFSREESSWNFRSESVNWEGLPEPSLRGAFQFANASSALAALLQLRHLLPVSRAAVEQGLRRAYIPGRFEVVGQDPKIILDVAHNPHGARALAQNLRTSHCDGLTVAVFGMKVNKDIAGVIRAMKGEVSGWMICGLEGPRGASAQRIEEELNRERITYNVFSYPTPAQAYDDARRAAGTNGRVVVFGSFLTVAEVVRVRGVASDYRYDAVIRRG